jgi:HK97 family phage portal protein
MVTPEGAVWYRLRGDQLAQVPDRANDTEVMVPARDIIHDRCMTLFHPLVGIPPLVAAGSSATQGIRIQANSERFFGNLSIPAGVLTFPPEVTDEQLKKYREYWQANYGSGQLGSTAVLSGGAKFESVTMPAQSAQLIEQLRWTVEDVARCFHVPLHKVNQGQPTLNNITALNQDYYTQTLQKLIEDIELLLDEGLGLGVTPNANLGTELDLEGILRMDPLTMAQVNEQETRAGYLAPNEARARVNLSPVTGGQTPYMQQQNWSLAALDKRPPPEAEPKPSVQPAPAPAEDAAKAFMRAATARFLQEAAHAA